MSCNCNESQNKTLTCFNKECLKTWEVEKEFYERTECPLHKFPRPIICGVSTPTICLTCENDGYYVERVVDDNSSCFFPKMELRKM